MQNSNYLPTSLSCRGNIWRNLGRYCQETGDIFNVWERKRVGYVATT